MEIHGIDQEGKISPYKRMPTSMEKEIEDFIEKNPSLLEDIIIIGRQVHTDEGDIIDLMGLDREGNVVIIELKKEEAPRKVISQILDYGVWAQDLTVERLNEIAKQNHLSNYKTLVEKFQEWTDEIDIEFNQSQKLYVVAEGIDLKTKKLAEYLRNKGIEIFCIEINFFEKDGKRLIHKHEVVGEEIKPNRYSVPVSEDVHLNKGSESTKKLYLYFKEHVINLGKDVKVKPVKNYIAFSRNSNFLSVRIKKDFLLITIITRDGFNDPKNLTSQTEKYHYGGRLRKMEVTSQNQIQDLMSLIKQMYEADK